jgi:hypothetical protein
MCIFSGQVELIGGTKIFARMKADGTKGMMQYLVYSMNIGTDKDVAMILPLPVSSYAEDAVKFIALDAYPEFFDDMEKGFHRFEHAVAATGILAAGGLPPRLEVHEVGDFIASFVPTQSDFDRLDARFRLPTDTWDQLPQYRDWSFAAFQLKAATPGSTQPKAKLKRIHPMAFLFPTRLDEALYFPTLHIHDGTVNEHAEFDHALYFQGEQFAEFADQVSEGKAVTFVKVGKAKVIVQPNTWCGKRTIVGSKPNRDTLVPSGGRGEEGQTGA